MSVKGAQNRHLLLRWFVFQDQAIWSQWHKVTQELRYLKLLSSHRQRNCLSNSLFGLTPKPRIAIFSAWPVTGGFPSQRTSKVRSVSMPWASYQIRKIAGCACAGNAWNVFPRRRFQREPLVSDPGMHHGTCVTHVPWCMSGSLTCGDGENVPGIPGDWAPAILRIWQEARRGASDTPDLPRMPQTAFNSGMDAWLHPL